MNLSSQQYRRVCSLAWLKTGAKPSTIRSKHKYYLQIIIWIVFLFQIKRLNLACLVLYLHRKSNSIVLMFVTKRIKASIKENHEILTKCCKLISRLNRLRTRNTFSPPRGNFRDNVFLKVQCLASILVGWLQLTSGVFVCYLAVKYVTLKCLFFKDL